MDNRYSEDYYERGRQKSISGYENFSWQPTRTISEAISIVEKIDFETVLDFGAAKGFLVHALSLLGKKACGIDISEYAVTNCLPQVKEKMILCKGDIEDVSLYPFDLIIAKDVLEHLTEEEITKTLRWFYKYCDKLFIVVPLGDSDLFRVREYEIDTTHITKKDEEWWIGKIVEAGFKLKSFNYTFGEVKSNWKHFPHGNGFFVAAK